MENNTEQTYTVTLTNTEWAWVMFALGVVSVYEPKVSVPYIYSIARKIGCAIGALKREGE